MCFVAAGAGGGGNDVQWCFSQVKGAIDDDVAEGTCFIYFIFISNLTHFHKLNCLCEAPPTSL